MIIRCILTADIRSANYNKEISFFSEYNADEMICSYRSSEATEKWVITTFQQKHDDGLYSYHLPVHNPPPLSHSVSLSYFRWR
jgi:hypothetical protein